MTDTGEVIALIKAFGGGGGAPSQSEINSAVATYLENHPEAVADEKYYVTFTPQVDQSGQPDMANADCDKTMDEIAAAYVAGKNIIGIYLMQMGTMGSLSATLECSRFNIEMRGENIQMFIFYGVMAFDGILDIKIIPTESDSGAYAWNTEITANLSVNVANPQSGYNAYNAAITGVANPVNNLDVTNKQYVDNAVKVSVTTPASGTTFTLDPYPKTYAFGEKAELTVTVTATSQYHFSFSSPSATATVLTMNGITGTIGDTVEAGKDYEVDIWAGTALIKAVEVTPVT